MKLKSVIGFSLFLGAWAPWALAECEHDHHAQHHDHAHHHAHNHTALSMSDPVPEESLHQLDSVWVDQNDEQKTLSDFSGRFLIVSMIYANCQTACPLLVEDARRIYNALSPEEQAKTAVLMISLDSENDTPERLNDYAERIGLNAQPWHFATGSEADVRTLAALLGVRYRKNPAGGYDHSNVVAVLNPQGEIIHRQEGLNRPASDAVAAVRQPQ